MAKNDVPAYGLGIDLGGTKILAGVVELKTGKVIASVKKRTKTEAGIAELLDRMGDAAEGAIAAAKLKKGAIATVGVAAAGLVDQQQGILLIAPNLGGLTNIPIGPSLTKRLGLPVTLDNDVQGAALGELTFGAAQGCDRAVCVFVGTGIGGALISDGKIHNGATGTAGEIGHTIVHADGRYCGCGGRGHLEAYASRTAITKRLQEELRRGRKSVLTKLIKEDDDDDADFSSIELRSGTLAKAFAQKDELTVEVVQEAAQYLGYGLASLINLFNPQRIVLGGGVIEALPEMIKVVHQVVQIEALPVPGQAVEIVHASLGDDSGIVGAALLGAQAQKK